MFMVTISIETGLGQSIYLSQMGHFLYVMRITRSNDRKPDNPVNSFKNVNCQRFRVMFRVFVNYISVAELSIHRSLSISSALVVLSYPVILV